MKESQFWATIDELEGCADEASVHELHELLMGEDDEDVAAFQRHLVRHLSELRRRAEEAGYPLGEAEACAVVAAGRGVYTRILSEPEKFHEGEWDCEEAILLEQTAPEVLEFLQGLPELPEGTGWLGVSFGSDFTVPPVYEKSVERLIDLIEDSPEWSRWWEAAESPRLLVILELMKSAELREPPRLRRRLGFVEFSMSVDPQRIRRLRLPGKAEQAAEIASDDLATCLKHVSDALSLGAIPSFPRTAER
ncbi:hypothetical protein ACFYO0_13880 [Streptomyces sp. NPDC006365]|uniref:hypothetical protein n=1 Tax=Streptomyces sp. NPDC006365 TaxID=3364744 RepID=UPI0036863721